MDVFLVRKDRHGRLSLIRSEGEKLVQQIQDSLRRDSLSRKLEFLAQTVADANEGVRDLTLKELDVLAQIRQALVDLASRAQCWRMKIYEALIRRARDVTPENGDTSYIRSGLSRDRAI
jgi:hypothetical protein